MSETYTAEQVQEVINMFLGQYWTAVGLAVTFVLTTVAVACCWWIYEKFFTPDESKFLRKAFRKKQPLLALGGDDGYCDLFNAPWSGSEGVLRSPNKGKSQEHYTGCLPRQKVIGAEDVIPHMTMTTRPVNIIDQIMSEREEPQAEGDAESTTAIAPAPKTTITPEMIAEAKAQAEYDEKIINNTVKVANYVSMIANRRLILRGAKVPVWFGYRGKAILVSLYGLIALQVIDMMAKASMFKEIFATVDVLAVKALFSEQWNESQINANETDSERVGELKNRKFAGKESLIIIFALLAVVCVLAILVIVAAYYLH